ncbi:ras-related protein Rab-26-like [Colossoma macropomum]|uniref:small monomeric GTPase n=1 Tax=Pygocentrus nattereri TaxID=42514 RepID=A0A3B4E6B3_PYGNA|nr:ras-related protein Rab-26 [Pygocentrus nattereri]XP_036446459.1 ras-related protein Rab-26-like [Colossoma macropomum]
MSRKKASKGKGSSGSPSAATPAKESGRSTRSSLVPGVQANGVVHPSRPPVSSSSEFYDIAFKVMLVGDSGVGKTCLLVRFKDGAFLAGSFISTVGIDFRNKVLNVDGVKVKLQIWDTAGQERFRSVTHAYYRDAHALLLLYDVTNKASFDNIRAWLSEIHEYAQQDVVLMLLGNKADASHDRSVRREEGERLAKEFGVPFMETSARSGLNVELAFTAIAKELKHRSMKEPDEPKFKLHEYVNKEMKTAGCCRS